MKISENHQKTPNGNFIRMNVSNFGVFMVANTSRQFSVRSPQTFQDKTLYSYYIKLLCNGNGSAQWERMGTYTLGACGLLGLDECVDIVCMLASISIIGSDSHQSDETTPQLTLH